MTNKDFHPFQIWCCNQELYERGEPMGLARGYHDSKKAVEYYEENCALTRGRVAFEFRLYDSPSSYKVL